ncbi:MAG: N-acetyltransferase family protein [Halocynthiibacter sp.]
MTIRPARPADTGAICTIWNHEIGSGFATFSTEQKTPEALAELIAVAGRSFLVAVRYWPPWNPTQKQLVYAS